MKKVSKIAVLFALLAGCTTSTPEPTQNPEPQVSQPSPRELGLPISREIGDCEVDYTEASACGWASPAHALVFGEITERRMDYDSLFGFLDGEVYNRETCDAEHHGSFVITLRIERSMGRAPTDGEIDLYFGYDTYGEWEQNPETDQVLSVGTKLGAQLLHSETPDIWTPSAFPLFSESGEQLSFSSANGCAVPSPVQEGAATSELFDAVEDCTFEGGAGEPPLAFWAGICYNSVDDTF